MSEPKGQIIVVPRLEKGERAFEMSSRFDKLSCEPVRHALDSMRDAGLGRIGPTLDVGEKNCRLHPH